MYFFVTIFHFLFFLFFCNNKKCRGVFKSLKDSFQKLFNPPFRCHEFKSLDETTTQRAYDSPPIPSPTFFVLFTSSFCYYLTPKMLTSVVIRFAFFVVTSSFLSRFIDNRILRLLNRVHPMFYPWSPSA